MRPSALFLQLVYDSQHGYGKLLPLYGADCRDSMLFLRHTQQRRNFWLILKNLSASQQFTWTAWNDGQINDLTTNLKNSQGNIALISALLLSVFTAFLRIGDAGSDDYNVLLYVIPWTFGSIFTFMSALLAVLFLLQINELGSREEAEQYSDRSEH